MQNLKSRMDLALEFLKESDPLPIRLGQVPNIGKKTLMALRADGKITEIVEYPRPTMLKRLWSST